MPPMMNRMIEPIANSIGTDSLMVALPRRFDEREYDDVEGQRDQEVATLNASSSVRLTPVMNMWCSQTR